MTHPTIPPFTGVCTALVTPFSDGEIDRAALRDLIEAQIEGGVDAICLCGTTGESATLTERERAWLIPFAGERIAGRARFVVGVGTPSTRLSCEHARAARDAGADALLAVTPYYNRGTPAGIVAHFHAIADAGELPVILYNVPGRTGYDLPVPLIREIARHPLIRGIKEAGDSTEKLAAIAGEFRGSPALYAGNDAALLPVLSLGGAGVISVLSNLLPAECAEICRLWWAGDVSAARERQLALLPLIRLLFRETNPAPIKCALAQTGAIREEVRLPLSPVPTELKEKLRKQMGLSN